MTSCEALALAEERGVTLAARGEQLILKGKAAREIAPLLAPLKPELLAHLRDLAGAKVLPFVLPAPKAGALLAHCTRVRSDTSVTPADVEALAAHFEALGREAAIASERRLWSWWKTEAVPSVGAFLASEPKQKQPMPSRDGKGNAA
jgi:hypothetical protein